MTEGSVTRAANALCMTQPAVSNALARLRDSLDDPLFVRAGNGVIPTQRAAVLWSELGEALDRMRGALDAEAFDPARATMEFSLSMSDYIAGIVLPPLFGRLEQSAPQARARRAQHAAGNPGTAGREPRRLRAQRLRQRSPVPGPYPLALALAGGIRLFHAPRSPAGRHEAPEHARLSVGAPRGREPGRPDAAVLRHVPVGARPVARRGRAGQPLQRGL